MRSYYLIEFNSKGNEIARRDIPKPSYDKQLSYRSTNNECHKMAIFFKTNINDTIMYLSDVLYL